jgi:hypothetical protein
MIEGQLELLPDEIIEPKEVEVWQAGKLPISLLKCITCYLRDNCPLYDEERGFCKLEELQSVEISTPEDIVNFVKTLLSIQAQRIIRLVNIESAEGGIADPQVNEHMKDFVAMVEALKKILSNEDSLYIRASGKSAKTFIGAILGDLQEGK